MSLEQTPPEEHLTPQSKPALMPYTRRFIKQVAKSTHDVLVSQQLITTFILSLLGVPLGYYFGIITKVLSIPTLLTIICSYAIILLLIVIINVIRAPFMLDRGQNQRIDELRSQLSETERQLEEMRALFDVVTAQLKEKESSLSIPELKANLIIKRIRVTQTYMDRQIDEASDGFITALVEFKNEADAPFPTAPANVRASISFEEMDGGHTYQVSDGAWLKARTRIIRFRLGDTKELVIAMQGSDGVKMVGAYERRIRLVRRFAFEIFDLPDGEYNVVVQLVAERPSRFLGKYLFRLTTYPQFHLEEI